MATPTKRNRRAGDDRRQTPERRRANAPVANDRRSGTDRRIGDRRRNRGLDPLGRLQAAVVLGAVLAIPAVRTWMDGAIPIDTMMVRIAIGMVLAVIAVNGINALLVAYTPAPKRDEPRGDGVEDAELVEGGGLAGESPL